MLSSGKVSFLARRLLVNSEGVRVGPRRPGTTERFIR